MKNGKDSLIKLWQNEENHFKNMRDLTQYFRRLFCYASYKRIKVVSQVVFFVKRFLKVFSFVPENGLIYVSTTNLRYDRPKGIQAPPTIKNYCTLLCYQTSFCRRECNSLSGIHFE